MSGSGAGTGTGMGGAGGMGMGGAGGMGMGGAGGTGMSDGNPAQMCAMHGGNATPEQVRMQREMMEKNCAGATGTR